MNLLDLHEPLFFQLFVDFPEIQKHDMFRATDNSKPSGSIIGYKHIL